MANSLGELFIELAFEGNTEEAEKFKKTMNETATAMQKAAEKAVKNAKAQLEDKKATDENTKAAEKNNKEKSKQKDNLKSVISTFAGYVASITGAIYAVKKLTDSLIEQNQTWLNLTRTSDVALSTYQKWNAVGKMYGINNAAQQIKNLNDRLFELKLTGAGASGFILAGVMPTKSDDVMEQLRKRVSGLSDNAASYLLRQMGLDENMLHILRLSRSEFNALNAEMKRFQLTDEQRKNIQEMNLQLQIASQKLQYLKDRAVLAILPHWIKFLKFLSNAGEGIKLITERLTPLEKNILKAAIAIGVLKGALLALTAHPIIASLTALLGIILLIADDFRAYSQGYDSGLGYLEVFFKKLHSMSLDDFFEKLESILNHSIPDWLKTLITAIDRLDRLYRYHQPEFKAQIESTRTKIKERLKNATPEEKAFYTSFTNDDLLNYGSLENAFKDKMGYELPISPVLLDKLHNKLNNEVFNNNKNINVQQTNNFNTSESAKEVYNSLLPWTGALNFANRNFVGQGNY